MLVSSLVARAKSYFGLMVEEGFYEKALASFLKRQDVRRFFELGRDVQVFCEQEIVNRFGDTKRIDRLMIFKDKVWIVDFKSSKAEQELHQKQMEEYQTLIKELYPRHQIEGFLVYLDNE